MWTQTSQAIKKRTPTKPDNYVLRTPNLAGAKAEAVAAVAIRAETTFMVTCVCGFVAARAPHVGCCWVIELADTLRDTPKKLRSENLRIFRKHTSQLSFHTFDLCWTFRKICVIERKDRVVCGCVA